jgi:hypothetical protein
MASVSQASRSCKPFVWGNDHRHFQNADNHHAGTQNMNAPLSRTGGALLLLFSLSGCAQNQTLSPPPDGEQVSITVKVPQNLAAEPMRVIYRSEKCPIKRSGPDWSTYKEDGYLATTVQPKQQGQSDLYEAKLPINGGGRCQWQLSNVTFGVTYANTTHFGQNVKSGPGGGGVIVMFDHYLPQQRSAFEPTIKVSGDVLIRKDGLAPTKPDTNSLLN